MLFNKNPRPKELQQTFDDLKQAVRQSDMPRRIELCQKALTMVSRGDDPELWAKLQDDLATSLARSPMGVRADNLEQAIHHYGLALEVRSREKYPKEWASTQNNLATAYRNRIYGERAKNIERSIDLYQQSLEERTRQADPKLWAVTKTNLAGAYHKRIYGDRAENLELAIQCSQEVIDEYIHEKFPYYWAQAQNILGEVYRVRIRGSKRENIELAVQHFNRALKVFNREAFPEDWAMVENNLANAYLDRIDGLRADNIDQAIEHYTQALKVGDSQVDLERWARIQYNLGNIYRNRILGDQAENIEQAIYHFELALEVRTSKSYPEDWAQTKNNLGIAYLSRIRGKRDDNIEQAIHHFEQALQVRTRQSFPADWAETQNNLGNACLVSARGRRIDNIARAIECYSQALEVRTREAYPADWAQTLKNLAGAERARASESIEQSIAYLNQSLEVYTREDFPWDWAGIQNNLAIAYTDRGQGERTENVEQAIHRFQQALEVYTRHTFPDLCLKTARALGNLAFEKQRWELAREAYNTAFAAQDVLMQASFTRVGKQVELGEVQNLSPQAAYASVQLNDLKQAVELLEQGRARLLRESLERRRQDLQDLPGLGFDDLYQKYVLAMQHYSALQNKGPTAEEGREQWLSSMEQALHDVQIAAAEIRENVGKYHPQYLHFLQPLPFEEIQKQTHEKPIIYLIATAVGGLALIVSEQGIESIKLPMLHHGALQKQVWRPSDEEVERINEHLKQGTILEQDVQVVRGGFFSMYALWSLAPYLAKLSDKINETLAKAWQDTIEETTGWLWDAVMGSLVDALKKDNRLSATLIPSGQLALLPLHAAWMKDPAQPTRRMYALDQINFNYAPSAHALWQAGLAAGRPAETLLAVDNPDGSLLFSEREVQAALGLFKSGGHLHGEDATIEAVKRELRNAHVLHFSTHGNAGWEEEEQARLKLANGYLTLPEIFELHLDQARLAVLSACETGVPSLKLIDELIGLPSGMMQAGVPGVIGSLWSVNARSTAMLMSRFYILWREDKYSSQEALRLAQVWLRDSTKEEKMIFFKKYVGNHPGPSAHAASSFYMYLMLADPGEVDFSSPFYWAAFTYTGI